MTRKDYELIAKAIRDSQMDPDEYEGEMPDDVASEFEGAATQHKQTAYDVCRALAEANPRFDRDKFLRACGV